MHAIGIQADLVWEDPPSNCERLAPRIAAAKAQGADLVVLPEMFTTGFSMAAARLAEPEGGLGESFLARMAAEHHVAVVGSIAQRSSAGATPRNVAVLVHADGRRERYAKIHPFTFAQEDRHYAAGTCALITEVAGARIALAICYDLRFPEFFAHLAARVDAFVIVANWPESRREHWRSLLLARSIETMAYVMAVNRVGTGGNLSYCGDSVLHAPGGSVVSAAAVGVEASFGGVIDPHFVADARARFPVLADRKPELYRQL